LSSKQKSLVALDAGSAKTCVLVAAEDEQGRLRFRGWGCAESKGWKKGAIINLEAAVLSIRRAMEAAEESAGTEIERAVVGVGAAHVKGLNSRGGINISSRHREIQKEDVRRAIEEARRVQILPDRVILHVIPQEYLLDSLEGIRDPVGMTGGRLEVNVHVITAAVTAQTNLVTAVNRAGLEVEETVFEALAASEAAVGSDERELGVVVADIGAGSTDVVVYHQGYLQHSFSLPVAGDHFTNDIAVGLRTPIPEAERIKRGFGVATLELAGESVSIEVPRVGDRPSRLVPQMELARVLQPRAQELLELIFDELRRAGLERQMGGGVVFTGGGARLAGLCDIAEQVLNPSARIGLAPRLEGSPEELCEPAYTTLLGLLYYAQRLRQVRRSKEQTPWGRMKSIFTGGKN
jgi:cell division protein FtsA